MGWNYGDIDKIAFSVCKSITSSHWLPSWVTANFACFLQLWILPLFSFTRSCKWHWSPRLEQVYICVWYIHLSVIYIICMTSLWDMVIRFISLVCILSWELYLSQSFWIVLKKWFHWLEFKILCVQIVYPLLPLLHPAESTLGWLWKED